MSRFKALLNIGIFLVYLILFVPLAYAFNDNGQLIKIIIIFLMPILLCFLNKDYLVHQIELFEFKFLKWILFGAVFIVLFEQVYAVLLGDVVDSFSEGMDVDTYIFKSGLVFNFLLICVIGSFFEEFIFRASLFHAICGEVLVGKLKIFISFLTSIMVFSLLHVSVPVGGIDVNFLIYVIPYFILSGVILLVYYKTNFNLISVFILHMLNNMIAFVLVYVSVYT